MIDQDFCDFLEYELCDAFAFSDNELVKGFWCDGVLLPGFENSQKLVNDNRKITMIAFVGKTGQDEYELTISVGRRALSKYARGLDISDCVPDFKKPHSFDIDTTKKKLTIQVT